MTSNKAFLAVMAGVFLSWLAVPRAGAYTYSDTFESYTNGTPLVNGPGTNYWFASSTDCIAQTNDYAPGGGTKSALIPIDGTLSNRFTDASPTNVAIHLEAKLVRYEGTNDPTVDANATAIFYLNSNGLFVAYDGFPNDQWVTLGNTPISPNTWTTNLDIYLDFSTKTWEIDLGTNILSSSLNFANPNASVYNGFDVYNGSDSTTYLDNVSAYNIRFDIVPTTLAPDSFPGQNASNQTFNIISRGVGTIPYIITTNITGTNIWLRINSGQGVLTNNSTNTITVTYSNANLGAGTYSAILNVINTNEDVTKSVAITLNINTLFVYPSSTNTAVMHGYAPSSQVYSIRVDDADGRPYAITTNVSYNWMAVRPGIGTTVQGYRYVTNNFSTNGLNVGSYTAVLFVTTTAGIITTDDVTLVVSDLSRPVPTVISSYAQVLQAGVQPANTNLAISNTAAAPRSGMRYTVTSDSAWLPTATSGVCIAAETRSFTVQFANMTTNSAGTYNGMLTIQTVDTNTALSYTPVGQVSSTKYVSVSVTFVGPGTPGSLSASDGTDLNAIALTWTATTNANHYEVYRATVNDFNQAAALDTNVATTSYSDTSVNPGLYRYYWVRAINDYGSAGSSASDSGYRYLPPPTGLTASSGTYTNRVALSWTAASIGAVNYALKRHTIDNLAAATVLGTVSASTTTYDDTSAAADTTYYYWVGSATPDMTNYSSSATGSRAGPLVAPANISATQGTRPYSVRVSWNAVANATSYEVARISAFALDELARSLATNGLPIDGLPSLTKGRLTLGATTSTFYDDNATLAGAAYSYTVRAKNALGYGDYSSAATGWRQSRSATTSGKVANDYDGDKLAEVVVFNCDSSVLRILSTLVGEYPITIGDSSYVPVRGDYDGDNLADPAIYSATNGSWILMPSSYGWQQITVPFGGVGQQAVPADFDGDQKPDPATYDAATGTLRVMVSGYGYAPVSAAIGGGPGYVGAFADYDGDHKADLAIYSASEGLFNVNLSGSGYAPLSVPMGGAGIIFVPGDFDGDGKSEVTTYNEATGMLTAMLSSLGYFSVSVPLGGPGYAWVVPADYDGDSFLDPAVYSSTNGWIIMFSAAGYATVSDTFGGTNNVPFVP